MEDESPLHILVASSITAVRSKLQILKHSDEGAPEEVEQVEECLRGIEAFVALSLQVAWATFSDEALAALQNRLDPRRAPIEQSEVG